MSAQNIPAPTATDWDINALIDDLGAIAGYHRRAMPQRIVFGAGMERAARALVLACGVPEEKANTMRPHEFATFYNVALKDIGAAKRMALKYHNAPVLPQAVQTVQGIDAAEMESLISNTLANLSREVLDTARDDTSATLARWTKTADLNLEHFKASLPAMVASELAKLAPTVVQIQQADKPAITIQNPHMAFERVLRYSSQRIWPYLVGPAGSGKTTLAEHVATALGLPFYCAAKVDSKFELMGHIQPHDGSICRTPFREAYEHGGVFLLDEMDGSNANALNSFNAALANGHCPFPDGLIARHPDFVAIGAGNTYGKGASRQYVGRTQIDDATLDRFAFIEIDYDEKLERQIATNADWCSYVQAVRAEVMGKNIRHIVSPRATYAGSKAIAAGDTWEETAQALIWKGLDVETVRQINRAVPISNFETSIL
jgi:hypothetical protein